MKIQNFVSIIWVAKNRSSILANELERIQSTIAPIAEDYEIIVIDNGSEDKSLELLKELTSAKGLPNIQVFALTQEVHYDIASWVGLENSLGDCAIVYNPEKDEPEVILKMIDLASQGKDIVFAKNLHRNKDRWSYELILKSYNLFLKKMAGIDLINDIPQFRLISRKVINYLFQFSNPAHQYRFLSSTAGFNRATLTYTSKSHTKEKKSFKRSFERGIALLISTTKAPMRIVTSFTLFGAAANLVYSLYVIYIAMFKADVAPGWVTLSLQQSGMFFLFSVVLFILGEYILYMANTNTGPSYHIAQEMVSATIKHREKLNILDRSNG